MTPDKPKLLVVDDERDVLQTLEMAPSQEGYDLTCALEGRCGQPFGGHCRGPGHIPGEE